MKLEGTLPIPSMSATFLEPIGRAPRLVVIHGDRGWQRRLTERRTGGIHICKGCGDRGHHRGSKRCPKSARST